MITFEPPNGELPAYFATPEGDGSWPGVVIVHDAFGLTSDIRRIADRVAGAGYLAIVPALYRRGNRVACVVRTLKALQAGDGPAVADLTAARDLLAADPRCTGKVGTIGFCMGGGFSLLLAPRGVFDAAAPNYGLWPPDRDALEASCPTVASYGAKDRRLAGAAAELTGILERGRVPHDVKEYPGVGHAFMNDWDAAAPLRFVAGIAGLSYSEPEAEDAWARILAFFGEHLH